VPRFSDIAGQKQPISLLQTFLRNSTLPHALLFTGIEGIGKQAVATALAMALNCGRATDGASQLEGCSQCRSCRQIASGTHPDIIQIAPSGNIVRIEQIRQLLTKLAMKPHSAVRRVVIVTDSHRMNPEAGNALLKVLEEPPSNTSLILTAHQQSDLLPTIVSRCRHIRFQPIPLDILRHQLEAHHGIAPDVAEQAAGMAGGSLKKALAFTDPGWQQDRQWVLRASGLDRPDHAAQRALSNALAFSAQMAQRKDRVQDLLEILKIWIRDLIVWPHGPTLVMNRDSGERLETIRGQISGEHLIAIWDCVDQAQKAVAANANMRLTLDIMAIRMARHMAS